MSKSRLAKLKISRDSILFIVGIAGVIYQTIWEQADRPTLLVLFGAMIGLPAFLRQDEKTKHSSEKSTEQTSTKKEGEG